MLKLSIFRSINVFLTRASGLALVSGAALAHPGHDVSSNMLMSGLTHPLTGMDHLFAMLAVGLWSALTHQSVRAALWTPVSFLCLLLVGALVGLAGITLPAIEPMIMGSLLVLGLLIASRLALPNWTGATLVGFFAVFHGMAHGAELPLGGNAIAFIAGFMFTTLTLHISGLAAGFALQRSVWLTRLLGAGIAAYGVALIAA